MMNDGACPNCSYSITGILKEECIYYTCKKTIYTDILIPPIFEFILDLIRNDKKQENFYCNLKNYKKDYEHIFLEKVNISINSFILKGCINQKNINHYTTTLLNDEDKKKYI